MGAAAIVTTQTAAPIRVGTVRWRNAGGAWCLTVLAKTTYKIRPGRCPIAEEQLSVLARDRYFSQDGDDVYAPADELPVKQRIDVLVVGHAYAPRDNPTLQVYARLRLGSINKMVEVSCDRWWDGAAIRLGASFTSMPLRYEFTATGADGRNARGVSPQPRDDGRVFVPNLLKPGTRVERPDQVYEPIGFGAIPAHWPERLAKLRTRFGRPSVVAWRNRPLPEDLDVSYFNVAPADQQLDHLPDDAELVLENLSRDHAKLVTTLPSRRLGAVVSQAGQSNTIRLAVDTVWIDTDTDQLVMVWRQHCELSDGEAATQVRIFEQPDDAQRDSQPEPAHDDEVRAYVHFDHALPFRPAPDPAQQDTGRSDTPQHETLDRDSPERATLADDDQPAPDTDRTPAGEADDRDSRQRTASLYVDLADQRATVEQPAVVVQAEPAPRPIPFASTPTPPDSIVARVTPIPVPAPARLRPIRTVLAPPDTEPSRPSFAAERRDTEPPRPSFPTERRDTEPPRPSFPTERPATEPPRASFITEHPVEPPAAGRRQTEPPAAPPTTAGRRQTEPPAAPPTTAGRRQTEPPAAPPSAAPRQTEPPVARVPRPPAVAPPPRVSPQAAPQAAPQPPARIGPLAGMEPSPAASKAAPSTGPATAPPKSAPISSLPADSQPPVASAPVPQLPLPLSDFPLARCAAIEASLDCRPDEHATILEREEVSPDVFKRLREHWRQHIVEANQRGDYSLLQQRDLAYLEQLEAERGEVIPDDYAQLKVAAERGTQRETAADLGIPLAAVMPIERQWLARTLVDPALAADARAALFRARTPKAPLLPSSTANSSP